MWPFFTAVCNVVLPAYNDFDITKWIPALSLGLTLSTLFTSAPLDNNSSTIHVKPFATAKYTGVLPAYNDNTD